MLEPLKNADGHMIDRIPNLSDKISDGKLSTNLLKQVMHTKTWKDATQAASISSSNWNTERPGTLKGRSLSYAMNMAEMGVEPINPMNINMGEYGSVTSQAQFINIDQDHHQILGSIDEEEAMPLRPQTQNHLNVVPFGLSDLGNSEVREHHSLRESKESTDTGLAELVNGIRQESHNPYMSPLGNKDSQVRQSGPR